MAANQYVALEPAGKHHHNDIMSCTVMFVMACRIKSGAWVCSWLAGSIVVTPMDRMPAQDTQHTMFSVANQQSCVSFSQDMHYE